jgi:hypothetical protein
MPLEVLRGASRRFAPLRDASPRISPQLNATLSEPQRFNCDYRQ